jgi:hypothetical protein
VSSKCLAETSRLFFAGNRERQVGGPGVLAVSTPLRLAVPRENEAAW